MCKSYFTRSTVCSIIILIFPIEIRIVSYYNYPTCIRRSTPTYILTILLRTKIYIFIN
nr:MAG TPA: hypothetical protein [Caudoviricetes sp.]